ncbi:DUF6441 family protein [Stappia sp. ES.058]|uniref:DUF6441 family protein n=1 Tax=Stappia sp. ES.058 TaxID=1881061 RepID=UPI00087ABFC2|nr:DUF6441 family protein [Stappia sp. ES.058]SDT97052.1 hypothetical protein SAMN05428979_0809 [Stappia sp. ES.058]
MTDTKLALVGNLQKTLDAEKTAVAKGIRGGMEALTDLGKRRLRQQVTRAGLGERLSKTWRGKVYPGAKVETFEPAGPIWSKAPHIVRAFSEGRPIRSKASGGWLAIPTDLAPPTRKRGARRKRMSMDDFLDEFGMDSLRVFAPPGRGRRVLYAVADKGFARGRGKRRKPKAEPLLMYVLVKQVRLRRVLNVDTVERGLVRLAPEYITKRIIGGLSDGQ